MTGLRPSEPRLATIADRDGVGAVVQAAYLPHVRRIGRPPGPMSDDYGALIAEKRVHVVDGSDGAVVAVLVLLPEGETLPLDNVAVAPVAQRSGPGRALMRFAETAAREAGCRRIRLYTNGAMTENIGSYRRLGYVETDRGEEAGFCRVTLVKTLG